MLKFQEPVPYLVQVLKPAIVILNWTGELVEFFFSDNILVEQYFLIKYVRFDTTAFF